MKEHLADLLIFLIVIISLIEATSKLSIPLSIIVFKTNGLGFVFTAYKTSPGNLFLKNFDANCIDFFLIHYTGSFGFS